MTDDMVKDHLATFHPLDFEAYNGRDWDLFAQLHTDDVIVEMGGYRTEGITLHVEAVKAMIADDPESRALVTIARWRAGRIAEEYLFFA